MQARLGGKPSDDHVRFSGAHFANEGKRIFVKQG